jgi:endogenous inhibitor of DNA gyrase (YacG/DUF329 family)
MTKKDINQETDTASPPCPLCSKPSLPAYKPFCSKRCADIDLHRWLTGSYAIPTDEEADIIQDLNPQPDKS